MPREDGDQMNSASWRRARSDFNHAWLKNRLIVSLGRARRVLDGKVEDDAVWEDLSALLADWPSRRVEALEVLGAYPHATSPQRVVETSSLSRLDAETVGWLSEVAQRRWLETEAPAEKLSRARLALQAVDEGVRTLAVSVTDTNRPESMGKLSEDVEALQAASLKLGEVFSSLGSAAP